MSGNAPEKREQGMLNRTTGKITTTLGILFAAAGFEHGLFAALQGNKPTDGLIIQAIGESMQSWEFGGEEALTMIPNFLVTGICAMCVSIFIVIWSLFFLQGRNGRKVFLLSFLVLVLVGGGIAVVPFFVATWAYSTRMDKPLTWWRKRLTGKKQKSLSRVWPYSLAAAVACCLVALEIAIRGYFPGQTDADVLLSIDAAFLLLTMIFVNLSFISGLAADVGVRESSLE
jgi:hypothetical protein